MFFIALAGVAFFFWFLAHLHGILSSAGGGSNRAAIVAVTSGTAFIVLFAVAE